VAAHRDRLPCAGPIGVKMPGRSLPGEQSADPTPLLRPLPPSRGSSEGTPPESMQTLVGVSDRLVHTVVVRLDIPRQIAALGDGDRSAEYVSPERNHARRRNSVSRTGTGDPPDSCLLYREISTGSRRAPQVPTGPSKTPGSSVPHRSQWPDSVKP